MSIFGLSTKSMILAGIMEDDNWHQLKEVTFCHVVEVVSRGSKQNLSHRFWRLGSIGRGPTNAIYRVTCSGGVESETTRIGRVKFGLQKPLDMNFSRWI